MYRFLLTPRWWGINIFALLAIPVCLLMGSWQLSRFDSRVDSHQEQQDNASRAAHAKAEPLGSLLPLTEQTVGRTAEATGRFDTERQLLVPGRSLDDKDGFYVLTLLRPDSAPGKSSPGKADPGKASPGKALPVVRGWLPGKADASRVPAPPKGEVTVKGVLQASESHTDAGTGASGMLPEDQLGFISAAGLVNVVPYGVQDAWITEQHTESPLKPVPPVAPDNTGLDMKAFQNLGYTAEWFVFAGFVVFMWFRLFRREAELARDAALGLVPERPERPEGPDGDPEDPEGAAAPKAPEAPGAPDVTPADAPGSGREDDAEQSRSPA